MAAVSQPGSRAGLITALVIFVVLFFVAAIFAVVKGLDNADKEKRMADLTRKYKEVISDIELTGDDVTALKNARQEDPNLAGRSLFDVLLAQRNELATEITGQAMGGKEAIARAKLLVQASNKRIASAGIKDISMSGGNLSAGVNSLVTALVQQNQQLTQLKAQFDATNEDMKARAAAFETETKQHVAAVQAAASDSEKAKQAAAAYRQTIDGHVAQLTQDNTTTIEQNKKLADDLASQIAAKEEEIKNLKKELERAVMALARVRPQDSAQSLIRRPDGRVVQTGKNGIVYIDLSLGHQITPGMTFQIYDKLQGIPKTTLDTEEGELPAGKGSLEVIRVGAGSSECRIIKLETGAQVLEGDLIANLIYDRNVKLKFKVHGKFDTDQNNVATDAEAEIVKRLIAQWGATLTDDVSIETDFVVMGREPSLPSYTAEELADDPIKKHTLEEAEKELARYEAIRTRAVELHIPVLNQNRFLYLIGFFDQAKK